MDNDEKDVLKEKIGEFAKILQNFGLNLIQTIGELKHGITTLTEKIDKIDNELIDLKGLKNSLQDVDKFRRETAEELADIKATIKNFGGKISASNNTNNPIAPSIISPQKPRNAIEILSDFEVKVQAAVNAQELRNILNSIREPLYITTGGHKVLFELRELEKRLHPPFENFEEFRSILLQKIKEWKTMV
jgi:FtsZ-binding cell division protein ZapB